MVMVLLMLVTLLSWFTVPSALCTFYFTFVLLSFASYIVPCLWTFLKVRLVSCLYNFSVLLDALPKLRKVTISFVMSVRPSVCFPHGTPWLPLDGFSWNLIFEYVSKMFPDYSSFSKIEHEHEDQYTSVFYLPTDAQQSCFKRILK